MECPLCGESAGRTWCEDRRRYVLCPSCGLIHVPSAERLDASAEKARYDTHRNDPHDERYRQFMMRLAGPLLEQVPPGAEGLDFGSGPAPVLAMMLREQGRPTRAYDPYYAPDESVWQRQYDFIAASEVFEHLYRPGAELERLLGVLRPGGVLAVMTSMAPATADEFLAWHYVRDPTHVCFYRRDVFEYIARRWGLTASFPAASVVLLRRGSTRADTARSG